MQFDAPLTAEHTSTSVADVIEEIANLFAEAESSGKDRIQLESMVGSKFHQRVVAALSQVEQL